MALFREFLGPVLRDLRLEQKLSLRQLAAAADMSATYLGEVERGLKEPSSEKLDQLASALDTSIAEILYKVADDLRTVEGPQISGASKDGVAADVAMVERLARRLPPDDVYSLARFGEFLLSRQRASSQ